MVTSPTAHAAVSVNPAPRSLDGALAAMAGASLDSVVVFIVPRSTRTESLALISQARAASLFNQVAVHVSELTPLGRAALTEMSQALISTLSPAQLLAALARLEESLRCIALLRSVAKLRNPGPTLGQHLLSWWPTTTFVAETGAAVRRRRSGELGVEVGASRGSVLIGSGTTTRQGPDFAAQLAAELTPSAALTRPVDHGGFWGTEPLAEFVIAPADLRAITADITAGSRPCGWCRQPFTGPLCPLCSPATPTGGPR